MKRILIVEDESDMQFVLEDNFRAEDYDVVLTGLGSEGARLALAGDIDLVILDIMLPDIDGFEVCRRIRAGNKSIPIVMLTAKGSEIDKVVGLELGADDYVTKPFGMRELLARVKAHLRRTSPPEEPSVAECEIGSRRVDFTRGEITGGNGEERLTAQENALLQFLATQRGKVLSRKTIMEEVWGEESTPGNRSVDNCIVRIRNKIEDDPSSPRHILTVHGAGYKLV